MAKVSYRRLRAPRGDGEVLMEPTWSEWNRLPAKNRLASDQWDFSLLGTDFQTLRRQARTEMAERAKVHTGRYSTIDDDIMRSVDAPVVMSGHQPELFHPGVWAKNFAVDLLAQQLRVTAIHVIIDNDLMRSAALRVPTGTIAAPRQVVEPFDGPSEPLPWEARAVADATQLESFCERVQERLQPLGLPEPLLTQVWPHVLAAVQDGACLGHAFAQARHRLELQWGSRSLEVPLSQLCETDSFRWFVLDLLARGELVRERFNDHVEEYRRVHRLRSPAQPIPNLQQRGEWTESPFWFWTDAAPQRRPLWWRRHGDQFEIGEPQSQIWTLRDPRHSPAAGVRALAQEAEQGLRIRPRAVTNTLFLRLFLSDLFVHGIGGAKYDQISDALAQDLYAIDPPRFSLLSLTAYLPVPFRRIDARQVTEARQLLRRMRFHPERYLPTKSRELDQVSSWIRRKHELTRQKLPELTKKQRHDQICAANACLGEHLQEKAEKQKKVIEEMKVAAAAAEIWSSREWSYVLFPSSLLRDRLLELRPTTS